MMINSIVDLAQKAGEKILVIYNDPSKQRVQCDKSDGSPLTLADQASHNCIVDGLLALDDSVPILSEENDTTTSYESRKNWQRYWLVDPLDGTKEFIKRNGEFTVNIALIENQVPIMGVVYAPVIDVTYYASYGLGAYMICNKQKQSLPIADNANPDVIKAVVSKSHLSDETSAYLADIERSSGLTVEAVSVGSSLKLCYVAEGRADVYPRLGPTMEWDTAAADCVVRESGARVVQAENNDNLLYNKPNLLNPHFIVARHPIV